MFKNKSGYARLDSPLRRADYSQYSAESSREGNGQTFHFSSLAVDSADEEEYELRSRASGAALSSMAAAPQQISDRTEYVTHDVASEDTLQTISIKYSVPIAELKRANNLYSEKELCARRFIRIPVRPNSLLTEPPTDELVCLEPADGSPGRLSPCSAGSGGSVASTEVHPFGDALHEGNKLLKNVDREVTAVRAKADELRAEGVLAAGGLAADASAGAAWGASSKKAGFCSCSGADCGVHWLCLVALALIVLVVIPVWYIVAKHEADDLGHHHHHHTAATHTTPSGGAGL